MSDTNIFSATRTAFERYGVKTSEKARICIMSTGLPRPGLARSAHRGRIKLLRGYVSKSYFIVYINYKKEENTIYMSFIDYMYM